MSQAKSRPEAKKLNVRHYFTGKPCPHGHIAERFTSSGGCVVCAAEKSASPEKKKYDKKYFASNAARISVVNSARYKRNRKQIMERVKRWERSNPERSSLIKQAYKHRRRASEASGMSATELRNWIKSQEKICYWCGKSCAVDYQVDHYEPLSKGGKHEAENLVIACPPCNQTKSAKDPYQFAQESCGRLF